MIRLTSAFTNQIRPRCRRYWRTLRNRGEVSSGPRPRCCQPRFPAAVMREYRDLSDESAPRPGVCQRGPCLPSPLLSAQLQPSQSLGQSDLQAAGAVLSSIWPPGNQGIIVIHHRATGRLGGDTSAALRVPLLGMFSPKLSALPNNSNIESAQCCPPGRATNPELVRIMAARIPTMLWPQWSLRLAEQNLFQRFLRSVLSVGLLLIGNDIEVEEAIESFGCPQARASFHAGMRNLSKSPDWPDVRTALYCLSDYLRVHGSPISRRRRQLDSTAC